MAAWYYNAICVTGEKRNKALRLLDHECGCMAKDIAAVKREVEKSRYFFYKLPQLLTPKEVLQDTRPWDKEFQADDRCNGCGTCSRVCPVQNITVKAGKPDFQHNCHRCMACIQYCPNNAIRLNGKPLDKPKYVHPDIPAREMIQFINKA
jgi:ferredoxin